jgi:D-alanyl-D-alanine carboxypeptidase (penicillin-binding protein 5/6)
MGTKSVKARTIESQSLLGYGFRFFESHLLYRAGQSLNETKVWKGEDSRLDLGVNEDLFVTVPRGQYGALDAKMSIDNIIMAPVSKGQVFGSVDVSLNGKAIINKSLVALKPVAEGGIVQQLFDQVLLKFQ